MYMSESVVIFKTYVNVALFHFLRIINYSWQQIMLNYCLIYLMTFKSHCEKLFWEILNICKPFCLS